MTICLSLAFSQGLEQAWGFLSLRYSVISSGWGMLRDRLYFFLFSLSFIGRILDYGIQTESFWTSL
ncbi:hypothetical protein ACN4EG_16360 [Alkalinema pantanalense CENA528]|uniref:hypothetical protein n=1 Tax=Alkalinema pantanalense TaxID=1620705 RepID=UPI003D6E9D97